MAGSELSLVSLTPADVDAGLALSGEAGWNQTADDWALFIAQGRALGFRSAVGELVATSAAIVYGGRLGWLSLVLVAPDWRHRGLASLLMTACVERLQASHVTPVLDATPAGEPVYRHFGFRPGLALTRWQGEGGTVAPDPAPEHRSAGSADLEALVALDQRANRLNRRVLLENLLQRDATRAWTTHAGDGFAISRAGRRARHIGPVAARGPAEAIDLLRTALAETEGPVFLDVPDRWTEIADFLVAAGFTRQRPFVRMALGSAQPLTGSDQLFALAGPEFG